jgi:membrane-associated phospholipid phosphatase
VEFAIFANADAFWLLFTRLGEAQILLPAAFLAMAALTRQAAGRMLAGRWLKLLAVGVALTTASKVAFIGWGWGWPALDFTGVSGHAMFAAAVYPVLLATLLPAARPGARDRRWAAAALGALLALLVGISRVRVQAHSVSEVLAGLALGGTVSLLTLRRLSGLPAALSPWVAAAAAAWFVVTPVHAPASQTHQMVTRLALALAGHDRPFQRGHWREHLRPGDGGPGLGG